MSATIRVVVHADLTGDDLEGPRALSALSICGTSVSGIRISRTAMPRMTCTSSRVTMV